MFTSSAGSALRKCRQRLATRTTRSRRGEVPTTPLCGRAGGSKRGGRRSGGRVPRSAPRPAPSTPVPFVMPSDGSADEVNASKSKAQKNVKTSGSWWSILFQRRGKTSGPSKKNSSAESSAERTPKVIDLLKTGAWVGIFSLVALEIFIHVLYKKDWLSILPKTQ